MTYSSCISLGPHPGDQTDDRRGAETLALPCISMGQQVAAPRLFKSHETASDVPAGARYVYVARNPLDAFVSFHRFLPAYTGLQPANPNPNPDPGPNPEPEPDPTLNLPLALTLTTLA